jgi:biotin transporter BioY
MPYDFGPFGSAGHSSHYEPDDAPRKNSIFSLIVMIVVVAIIGAVVLGLAFMALGVLFHLAGWILKVAILAAVAALIWRRINRRRSHDQV